jgi:hypothetical protein
MKYVLGTSVGERGQITIERAIRERLDIRPKDIAVQRVEDGRLVVEFVRPHESHMRSLAGILGPSATGPREPSSTGPREPFDIDDAVGRGIAEEWRDYLTTEEAELGAPAATPRRRRSTP